ncbi:hypothetical protein CEXT_689571 [Caerostris extrusa]|uniref:Uncharacterized protein n=1 Tax=Caerostris extrusa TaxID=172846 RepID=A0AAV4WH24_CAEEX|nr:hypothetical protein CEXT_689571 [Caerostris extrusa]
MTIENFRIQASDDFCVSIIGGQNRVLPESFGSGKTLEEQPYSAADERPATWVGHREFPEFGTHPEQGLHSPRRRVGMGRLPGLLLGQRDHIRGYELFWGAVRQAKRQVWRNPRGSSFRHMIVWMKQEHRKNGQCPRLTVTCPSKEGCACSTPEIVERMLLRPFYRIRLQLFPDCAIPARCFFAFDVRR